MDVCFFVCLLININLSVITRTFLYIDLVSSIFLCDSHCTHTVKEEGKYDRLIGFFSFSYKSINFRNDDKYIRL